MHWPPGLAMQMDGKGHQRPRFLRADSGVHFSTYNGYDRRGLISASTIIQEGMYFEQRIFRPASLWYTRSTRLGACTGHPDSIAGRSGQTQLRTIDKAVQGVKDQISKMAAGVTRGYVET